MNRFHHVVPMLNVRNFAASVDYYVNKLGFAKKWDEGTPPTFGCVWRDNIEIFLCEGGQGQPGTWMSIFIDDVDALFGQ
jgi:catechol 2,3-dioxygenase-like lactoylglutathione lyase family enzyme